MKDGERQRTTERERARGRKRPTDREVRDGERQREKICIPTKYRDIHIHSFLLLSLPIWYL